VMEPCAMQKKRDKTPDTHKSSGGPPLSGAAGQSSLYLIKASRDLVNTFSSVQYA
jgi:hypothetical protein